MTKHLHFAAMALGVLALIGCATAQGVYLNEDGSTFTREFSGLFGTQAPYSIYNDTFLQSEVVRIYNAKQSKTYHEPGELGVGGATKGGGIVGPAYTTGRMYAIVDTYEVTVTRHWYNRTTYYQNRKPEYSQVYSDKETRRLINSVKQYMD
jgi:hypothetical protein